MDRRGILLALACTCAATLVPAQDRLGEPVGIEDPSGHALEAFHASLANRQGRTRIMVWGASHTAEDRFTGILRETWQRRFGDAGPGLVLPAQPFPLYGHREVEIAPTGAWRPVRVSGRHRTAGRYGPAGFAIETSRRAEGWVATRTVDSARLFYLMQPGGGHFDLGVDDGPPRTIATSGDRVQSVLLTPDGGLRRLTLQARGDGVVRIYGVSLERQHPGVIVDAMGVPGARMRDRLPWDDGAMRRQLAELEPNLIVLAYGTNEAGFTGRPLSRYHDEVDEALRRAKNVAPGASCLLIGPSDWPVIEPGGAFAARPRTAEVIAIQREAALRHGCGYFDLVAFMGGPLSMPRWVEAGLALDDHVHFTDQGHRVLARVLSAALLRGFAGR